MPTSLLTKYSLASDKEQIALSKILDSTCSFLYPSIVSLWYNTNKQACFTYNDRFVIAKLYPASEPPFWSLASRYILESAEIDEAIRFVAENDQTAEFIRFVPAITLPSDQNLIDICDLEDEDERYSDYIYNLIETSNCQGGQYEDMRRHIRRYFSIYGKNTQAKIYEGWDETRKYKKAANRLFEDWLNYSTEGSRDVKLEEQAFDAFFNQDLERAFGKLYTLIITYKGKVVAFSVNEKLDETTLLNHFHKANLNLSSVSHYLFYTCASQFSQRNLQFLNFQEDNGIGGLRAFKKKMRPQSMTAMKKLIF